MVELYTIIYLTLKEKRVDNGHEICLPFRSLYESQMTCNDQNNDRDNNDKQCNKFIKRKQFHLRGYDRLYISYIYIYMSVRHEEKQNQPTIGKRLTQQYNNQQLVQHQDISQKR